MLQGKKCERSQEVDNGVQTRRSNVSTAIARCGRQVAGD